jgi:hypothetical protein
VKRSDAALLGAARTDPHAFRELYDRHADGITQHVNGGCRSLNDAGTEWQCYLGEEAVKQKIVSQGFLGQVQTMPAVG